MNETGVLTIIRGFLTDIAEVSWYDGSSDHSYFIGKLPVRLDSLYKIHLTDDNLEIYNLDEEKKDFSVRFQIEDETLYWPHEYRVIHSWDKPAKCSKIDTLRLADPKFFQNFVQVICLNLCEPTLFEFILKRIINKPKWRAMCPEGRMRNCRRRARYTMTCDEISEFIWKS